MRRRTLLATSGATLAAFAGCSSDGGASDDAGPATDSGGGDSGAGDSGTGETDSGKTDTEGTETATEDDAVSLAEAPIAKDISAQPTLGSDPLEAESVIVEVMDPTCLACRSFHNQAFPKIRSELVEAGDTAFVTRNVDWVYRWGGDACLALEAVHDRSPDVYWDLLKFYFDNQGDLSTDTVLERTESFLAETDVDGEAVVAGVEANEFVDAVSADRTAASHAGVNGQPYFFLFKDGERLTSFRGAQSYGVFESSLGY